MMNPRNVLTIRKYEMKLFRRSWVFRIFVVLGVAGVAGAVLQQFVLWDEGRIYGKVPGALSGYVPYYAVLLFSVLQAVVVIFRAGGLAGRKTDMLDVVYARPLTNGEYVAGKVWGMMEVCGGVGLAMAGVVALLHLAVLPVPFGLFPYLFYLLVMGLPSLLFMAGAACAVGCWVKNRAVAMGVMSGLLLVFWMVRGAGYGVADLFGVEMPVVLSDELGHRDMGVCLHQRMLYALAGIGLVCVAVGRWERLPHCPPRAWRLAGGMFVGAALVAGGKYWGDFARQSALRQEYAEVFNAYGERAAVHVARQELEVTPGDGWLKGESRMRLENDGKGAMEEVVLYLNPGLEVTALSCGGQPLAFERDRQAVRIRKPLAVGEGMEVVMHYEGSVEEAVCYTDIPEEEHRAREERQGRFPAGKRYAWLEEEYTLLTPECLWYPCGGTPAFPAEPYKVRRDFTDYRLTVHHPGGLVAVSQGEEQRLPGRTVFTNRTPLPCIGLAVGAYERKAVTVDSVLYEVFHFRGHDFLVAPFGAERDSLGGMIRDLRDGIDFNMGRAYPYRKFVLAEAPLQHTSYVRNWKRTTDQVLPEVVFFPERGHSWEVDFKKMLEVDFKHMPEEHRHVRTVFSTFFGKTFLMIQREDLFEGDTPLNPFWLRPMYGAYTCQLVSDAYPVLDGMFDEMGDEDFTRRFGMKLMNNKQRARLYLDGHSLCEAVEGNELPAEVMNGLLELKSVELQNHIESLLPQRAFGKFLDGFWERHAFRSVGFEVLMQEFKAESGVGFEDYLESWYRADRVPFLLVKPPTVYEITGQEEELYQLRVQVCNPSEVDAVVTCNYFLERMQGFPDREHYPIPARTAREIRLVAASPFMLVGVSTNISRNLPSWYEFFHLEAEKNTRDTSEGIFPLPETAFASDPKEIIIDNEDCGFRIVDRGKSHRLKDLFSPAADKYTDFYGFDPPARWTPVVGNDFYGMPVASAACKACGDGQSFAEWRAEIPREGYYRLGIWNNKASEMFVLGGNATARRVENIQYYTLRYGGEEETFPFNKSDAGAGWVDLGEFYLPQGAVTLTLGDKGGDPHMRYILADAVKFTLVE